MFDKNIYEKTININKCKVDCNIRNDDFLGLDYLEIIIPTNEKDTFERIKLLKSEVKEFIDLLEMRQLTKEELQNLNWSDVAKLEGEDSNFSGTWNIEVVDFNIRDNYNFCKSASVDGRVQAITKYNDYLLIFEGDFEQDEMKGVHNLACQWNKGQDWYKAYSEYDTAYITEHFDPANIDLESYKLIKVEEIKKNIKIKNEPEQEYDLER